MSDPFLRTFQVDVPLPTAVHTIPLHARINGRGCGPKENMDLQRFQAGCRRQLWLPGRFHRTQRIRFTPGTRHLLLPLTLGLLLSASAGAAGSAGSVGALGAPAASASAGASGESPFSEYDGLLVSDFEILGAPKHLTQDLEKGLALAGEKKTLRRLRPQFDAALFEEDLERTRLFLAREGYPWCRVVPRVEPRGGRKVDILIGIDPGPQVVIDSTSVLGLPEALAGRGRKVLALRPGAAFADQNVQDASSRLSAFLAEQGYGRATVDARTEPVDSTRVRVRFRVEPGSRYLFGDTHVEGIPEDIVPLAVRSLDIEPGTRYSPRELTNSQDNLRLLDLFRQIRLSTQPGGPDTLDVEANLAMRDPHTVETRVGYMSEDQFRASASWKGRNTFHGGRGLETDALYSRFLQKVEVSGWWPALIGPRTREVLTVSGQREAEDAYTQQSAGLEVATWYRRSFRTTLDLSAAWYYVDAQFESEAEEDITGPVTLFETHWNWDHSDDRLRPTRGTVLWARGQWSPPFLPSEVSFILGETGGSLYFPLPRRSVAALRLGIGLANPLGVDESLLPGLRFFAGGVNSNRGFQRHRLGPRNEEGDPSGGEAKLEFQGELRVPVFWRLQAAAFFDAGQVWTHVETMNLADLEPSVGWALMVDTPVGPIRGDWGYRLHEPGSEPGMVFHFLIGHPF